MSEFVGTVMFGLMGIAGLIAGGYVLYGLFMTLRGVTEAVAKDLHLPQIHHTGGLAPHH